MMRRRAVVVGSLLDGLASSRRAAGKRALEDAVDGMEAGERDRVETSQGVLTSLEERSGFVSRHGRLASVRSGLQFLLGIPVVR